MKLKDILKLADCNTNISLTKNGIRFMQCSKRHLVLDGETLNEKVLCVITSDPATPDKFMDIELW